MVAGGRRAGFVVAGLVLGAAAVGWLVGSRGSPAPAAQRSGAAAPARSSEAPARPVSADVARPAQPEQPPATATSGAAAPCPLRPALAAAGQKDGTLQLRPDLSGRGATDLAALNASGKEAAAAGRPRDAEVAFIMSCRLADKLKGAASAESADAKHYLGWHYANVALNRGAADTSRGELLRRAEQMYAASLQSYRSRLGDAHEKSRFAADGLATVQRALGPASAPSSDVAVAQGPVPRTETRTMGAGAPAPGPATRPPDVAAAPQSAPAPSPVPQADPAPERMASARPRPSFDCARARSIPEQLICADGELATLDRELGQLHATAKRLTSDRAGFQRRNDQEWRRREAQCRDRDCLLRWYAQRREQLVDELERSRAQPTG